MARHEACGKCLCRCQKKGRGFFFLNLRIPIKKVGIAPPQSLFAGGKHGEGGLLPPPSLYYSVAWRWAGLCAKKSFCDPLPCRRVPLGGLFRNLNCACSTPPTISLKNALFVVPLVLLQCARDSFMAAGHAGTLCKSSHRAFWQSGCTH